MRLAVDIGGANTKAAWFDGELVRTLTRPFEVWRDREALAGVLRELHARLPSLELLAGGGVRDAGDLRALARAGAAGALVATALHGGAIGAADLEAL